VNNVVHIAKPSDLEQFIHFLFDGLEGYMYVVAKEPDNPDSWDQVFFEYPDQATTAVKAINTYSNTHEIYIAPSLFKGKNATKESVKVTQVLWCDFDGNTPSEFNLPPSYIIRSSEPGHEHTYWKLDQPLTSVEAIEDYNRRLCYKYGADVSGWDATQVLRPPYTINHKRGRLPVTVLSSVPELAFNVAVFDDLAPAPEKTVDYTLWEKIDLPSLNDVIYSNKFGADFKLVFEKTAAEVKDRSQGLTHAAYICAEAGLNDKEIYVVISHLATRWEKFKHHTATSRARQLMAIIEHTRIKYPHSNYNDFDQVFAMSPKALMDLDIQIEWAIPGMLMKSGNMLFSGPGGIGKSQISIQFMAHLAVGKPFLHYKIEKPMKIGFFSLEMGDAELKHLLLSIYPRWVEDFTPAQIELLNQNLTMIPFGESLPLNTTAGQDVLIQYQEQYKWEGIFIDSVGSAILGNISSSETVQGFTNFNDKIRKRYGCFLWYVHHFRKPAPGTKQYGSGEDNYGDVYLFNRATSNYTMVKAKDDKIRIRNPKNRHAKEEYDYFIRREEGLTFSHQGEAGDASSLMELITPKKEIIKPENDQSPMPFFKKDNDGD
jgi:hypothetical protein